MSRMTFPIAFSYVARPHEGRNVWVVTAYAVSGLALFGVIIYYVSAFITQ